MRGVVIHGDGIAACCCAHLLKKAGLAVEVRRGNRPRLPVILLSDSAVELIRNVLGDVFPPENKPLHRIRKRVVAWGTSRPTTVEHFAFVVSEESLLETLWSDSVWASNLDSSFNVYARKPLPAKVEELSCGTRTAFATPVKLNRDADSSACWIESHENGWRFLIPTTSEKAWLLSIGDSSLQNSRLIANQIDCVIGETRQFPAYPRILSQLCGENWLACGTAAMAFDPLCGDGTAHAVREAVLASAVIQALAGGEHHENVFSHYQNRMIAGFARHLMLTRKFYQAGHQGSWWESEIEALQQGIAWCERQVVSGDFRYQLNGFELQPVRLIATAL